MEAATNIWAAGRCAWQIGRGWPRPPAASGRVEIGQRQPKSALVFYRHPYRRRYFATVHGWRIGFWKKVMSWDVDTAAVLSSAFTELLHLAWQFFLLQVYIDV